VKITATVAVGDKLYSGSSVQEFQCRGGGSVRGSPDVGGCRVNGEAVFVDIKDRGTLFLIFKGKNEDRTSYVRQILAAKSTGSNSSWLIEGDAIPLMITFDDPLNPRTLKVVNPARLDQSFGEGVRLHSIKVENTSSPVTKTLESVLPWVASGKSDEYLKTGTFSARPYVVDENVQRYDFKSRG
jgi:hypothetical protein